MRCIKKPLLDAVRIKEHDCSGGSRALIAVKEGLCLCDVDAIRGCHIKQNLLPAMGFRNLRPKFALRK